MFRKYIPAFTSGIITGLILQLAIGPIFIFVVNLALQKSTIDGLFGVAGAGLADFIYITLALFGGVKLLEEKKIKNIVGAVSSIILIIFGALTIKNALNYNTDIIINTNQAYSYLSCFFVVFIMTLSSPLTIVFWSTIFTSRAIEKNYSKIELLIFGFASGIMTFIFLGVVVILLSFMKTTGLTFYLYLLNIAVGSLLIIYGIIRFLKILKK